MNEAIKIKDIKFKNEELESVVKIMLDNNFKVLYHAKDAVISYVLFERNNSIGYVQCGDFGYGVRFSTVHKPNTNCGTGFGLDIEAKCTLQDIERAFIFAPNWAMSRDVAMVVKYKSLEDYFTSPINRILTYSEIVS